MSSKGSAFERDLCRRLSLWWTGGERDDVFWRTAGSGGRATNRRRRGRSTANSEGDICALDPVGADLLRVFAIECKRGYSTTTLQELLDPTREAGKTRWADWIRQATASRDASGALLWLVVCKRDGRPPLVVWEAAPHLLLPEPPCATIEVLIDGSSQALLACPLEHFLTQLTPARVRAYLYDHSGAVESRTSRVTPEMQHATP